ncbi:pre-mRNA-splicing factor 38B isoform X2 [Adelges cooleyi]|uniref:pre-mRNA-splicing factor 38B isoform X2 n=1 Tax=Adelges cooleyi TaxID=133065 RepID=UPI0021805BDB|nr:pre-mRNA-splicing factor 38B isoform X2 [Adelges cooleyi]
MGDNYENEGYDNDYQTKAKGSILTRKNNTLPVWGNERTMNLNTLILTNIQSSHYFKVNLYELKTYHEVIDEIYYKVQHLEPWEKGSRKTAGQTGMCGGVRGVGAGGIVSTAFCLLYKLYTLKLTRKQVTGLITHCDSPYIRGLGFMYIRYTQPPGDLWDWYESFLDDEEEVDVRAGGGQMMTIGNVLKSFLVKLEWFSTLFPRIPVPIQQQIEKRMNERYPHVAEEAPRRNVPERSYSRDKDFSRDKDDYRSRDYSDKARSRDKVDRNDRRDRSHRDYRDRDYERKSSYKSSRERSPYASRRDDYRRSHSRSPKYGSSRKRERDDQRSRSRY